ncbi:receptor-type tyrosine-protein phosphatase kappa-like protein [Leptotrombidium deliense]|uniref:Receptor-type tyrosine-protein phosphatase kappa-like protein n=1 Tax=Leptotrombidium deliense TaxID=299467 RepID=A0A443S5U9_9ACAR|nr:receptor-type tyrosine-protein phosphatase kappa-like protein [Leptotrombidium deliense]
MEKEYNSIPYKKYYKCLVARRAENMQSKHRFHFSQAYDYNRVVLNTMFSDEHKSDYIAASRIDSFKIRGRFIVTQAPLPETFNDFWQMVYENNCTQIVTFNALIERGYVAGHKYWPENGSQKFSAVTVNNYARDEKADFTINYYKVSGIKGTMQVEHYFYAKWPDASGTDCQSLFNLLHAVKHSNAHQSINPTLIHCSAGVGRSCTFILIYNLIEMQQECGKIDVYKCFFKLRLQRAYCLGSVGLYKFVYSCLNSYFTKNLKNEK